MSNRKNRMLITDTLGNLSPYSGASEDYCKGLIVGIVAALMAEGMEYREAWDTIRFRLPVDYRPDGIPPAFRD